MTQRDALKMDRWSIPPSPDALTKTSRTAKTTPQEAGKGANAVRRIARPAPYRYVPLVRRGFFQGASGGRGRRRSRTASIPSRHDYYRIADCASSRRMEDGAPAKTGSGLPRLNAIPLHRRFARKLEPCPRPNHEKWLSTPALITLLLIIRG